MALFFDGGEIDLCCLRDNWPPGQFIHAKIREIMRPATHAAGYQVAVMDTPPAITEAIAMGKAIDTELRCDDLCTNYLAPIMAFLSIRVPDDVRNRVKAIAAARGEKLQDLVGGLIERFLEEADRRPPQLADVLRRLREREADLRAKGVATLWVFGSVARGDARPDSDVDLLIDFAPEAEPSLLTLSGLQLDLADALGHPVDLGERRALKPRIAEAVERDLVRVF